ncbi:MAG: ABC transporter ATP-binding protein [Bowdeniella nasicola]|nr:ABC transporter ATP-binding protein [Bowdeniella nasicola]
MSQGLSIRDVDVHYGTTHAVRGVSFELARGEIVALLGPSGSGKSSLLRAIAGLEPLTAGDVRWAGESVVATPVHQRGFGLMFQDGQLFVHRSVAGNVAYGLAGRPKKERRRVVEHMLDLVGMSDYADRAVTSLSGGQAQRVALARALAPNPAVVLLDEPLSALDRSLREHLSAEIRSILVGSGSTGIYVTHDQDEAFTVADRVAVMIDGELARLGTPGDVWSDPRRCDVATFLGYGPLIETASGTRAIAPQALRVVGFGKRHTDRPDVMPEGFSTTRVEHPHSGGDTAELRRRVEVRDIRVRRGYTDVTVDFEGQHATARMPGVVEAPEDLVGSQIEVSLSLASCPIVQA